MSDMTNATHHPTGHRCFIVRREAERSYCNFIDQQYPFCYVMNSELILDEKQMTEKEIETLADEALDAACHVIQERLGVMAGDFASMFFSDDKARSNLRAYIRSEIEFLKQ